MPELPEVETLRRGLRQVLLHRRLGAVRVHETRLRRPIDVERLTRLLPGAVVERIERRAKYLLLHLDNAAVVVVHLGMSGRLLLEPTSRQPGKHMHLSIEVPDVPSHSAQLRFYDSRRFGLIDVIGCDALTTSSYFAHLGVEPLTVDCDGAYLWKLARGVAQPVKNFIMDSRRLVGVGNIYASEALFEAGIHPRRAAGRVSRARWDVLATAVKKVLKRAIRAGGTTLNDFAGVDGRQGYFQVHLKVYDRAAQPCVRCKGAVRRVVMAGRSTYYCSRCQH